jgi:hypothetical protein
MDGQYGELVTRKRFALTPPVSVEVVSFVELTQRSTPELQAFLQYPLALDNYQRPYVWDDEKINQLVEDLSDYGELWSQYEQQTLNQASNENRVKPASYYMGSLLLHENVNYRLSESDEKGEGFSTPRLCVIDGQQRLTSLAVLYFILNNELPEHIDFHYRSPISAKQIQNAKAIFDARKHEIKADIFKHLCFTIIKVEREDLAFTFFDTQNNRGVPLAATDLLKAYHLRAIDSELLQKHCARRWESQVQSNGQGKEQQHQKQQQDFAPKLFRYYLWRAKNWRGSEVKPYDNVDDMLHTFQTKNQTKLTNNNQIPLYAGGMNQFANTLTLLENDEHQLTLQPVLFSKQAASLPFAIRQPIQNGVGFFLYAEKYASLLSLIFDGASEDPELKALNLFYKQVVSQLSPYLTNLYRLAVLMYVDRLGFNRVFEFALWLDHVVGAIRLEKYYIFEQAPLNFLKDEKINLLDLIAFSYEGQEVIDYLKKQLGIQEQYQAENGWEEQINGDSYGVKERYVKALSSFYYGENSKKGLSNKHNDIDGLVKKHLKKDKCDV